MDHALSSPVSNFENSQAAHLRIYIGIYTVFFDSFTT